MIYWYLAGEQVSSWYARELWISNRWAKYQRSMSHRAIPTALPSSAMQSNRTRYGIQCDRIPEPREPNEEREEGSSEQVLGVKRRWNSTSCILVYCAFVICVCQVHEPVQIWMVLSSILLFDGWKIFARPMLGSPWEIWTIFSHRQIWLNVLHHIEHWLK